jgi:hypothetical protein
VGREERGLCWYCWWWWWDGGVIMAVLMVERTDKVVDGG